MAFKKRFNLGIRQNMQIDSLDQKTKNRFLLLFFVYVRTTTINPYDADDYGSYAAKFFGDDVFVDTYLPSAIAEKFNYSMDDCRRSTILQTIIDLPDYYETYELLEVFVKSLESGEESFISDVNRILEEEKCNYRMSNKGELLRLDLEEDLKNIEEAQKIPINSVQEHMQSALALYSDREENRNERKVCQEAIHAIEALVKAYIDPKFKNNSFDSCFDEMLKKYPLPSFIEKPIRKIYSESNSSSYGIRHALATENSPITDSDAYFVLMVSIIFVNYMQRKYPKEI